MAYHDEKGRITIDEVAARRDVQKMEAAIEKIEATIKQFNQLMSKASEAKGKTAEAVYDRGAEMVSKLMKSRNQLQDAIDLINRTVKYYYVLDKKLSAAIQAADAWK